MCGNSVLDTSIGETCDDGNFASGDGCSSACLVETGYDCGTGTPSPCVTVCGDNIVVGTEECDHGAGGSPSCTSSCTAVTGVSCTLNICSPICQDGIVVPILEGCDDMDSLSGDGCSATCLT